MAGPSLPDVPLRSVPGLIAQRASIDPQRTAIRSRGASGKWQDLSWSALDEQRRRVAAGLASLGVKAGDVVAFVSLNSPEMLVAEMAAQTLGAGVAPIFPGYSAAVLHHCLLDSGARVAVAGGPAQQQQLSTAKQLQHIVVLEGQPLPGDQRATPLSALERSGQHDTIEAGRDDMAWLLYTSGTTGKPKGVELTHWNALSQQAAIAAVWDLSERDVFLSYLPWHHCFGALFERMMALWHRSLLVIDDSRGRDLDRIFQNLAEVRPTVYFGVPRVYNAMIGRANRDAAARDALKGLRFVFSAAAPLSEPSFEWFEKLGVPVLEGWGLTETSPCATLTRRDQPRAAGMVGHPLPGTAVKLEPVPGLGSRGEILVRGPQIMRGYHNRPDDTARALREGWLRSGDLGEWTEAGLKLYGRIDGVFKLENGEKVSAGEVEARIVAATPLIEQTVVLGSSQPFVSALCWLSEGVAQRWLSERDLEVPGALPELVRVPELRRALVEALQAANLTSSAHFERVRRVALVPEAPSLETGELTPTMKMVRSVSLSRHAGLIAAMQRQERHPLVLDIFTRGEAFGNV
jgi:long-subunit acyl-CoA synthetase (AMP-forming)